MSHEELQAYVLFQVSVIKNKWGVICFCCYIMRGRCQRRETICARRCLAGHFVKVLVWSIFTRRLELNTDVTSFQDSVIT